MCFETPEKYRSASKAQAREEGRGGVQAISQ